MRICVVDDHEVVREGVRAVLASSSNHELVADAASGREALAIAKRVLPDVMVSEYQLPDMTGFRFCEAVRQHFPETAVVFLTSHLSEDRVTRALDAGAAGFVTKAAGLAELQRVLDEVQNGCSSALFGGSSAVVERLLRCTPTEIERRLTPRQERVLELAAQGLTYGEISKALHVSESTVRFHIQNMKERMDVRTRVELISVAIRDALIAPDCWEGSASDSREKAAALS